MSEAEVSLRVAMYLIENSKVDGDVAVAIDGAQVKTGDTVHFDIDSFFKTVGIFNQNTNDKWQGIYHYRNFESKIIIHSRPGEGDVFARLKSGKSIVIESKKGDLVRKPGGKEYPLIREAIGQLVTTEKVLHNSSIFVAIPKSAKNCELVDRWSNAPLVRKLELGFIMIDRNQNLEATLEL